MSEVGWRPLRRIGAKVGADVRKVDRMILLGGGWVQVRSADDPDSLRGEGLDLVVVDECAFVKESAWGLGRSTAPGAVRPQRRRYLHQHAQGPQLVLAAVAAGPGRCRR
jgi:hypothetical protein